MEKYIVKISEKYPKNDASVKQLLTYIAGEGSNKENENAISVSGHGVSNNYEEASEQMIKIQRLYEKDRGRRGYHMIVSFEKTMTDKNFVRLAADQIARMIFEEMHYQIFYGIHTSTDNLHIHFAFNAVNYKSGKKFHQKIDELKAFTDQVRSRIEDI